ncbi:MAG: hypothetical protein ACLQPH_18695 [Acidimicrobiales bacterium]
MIALVVIPLFIVLSLAFELVAGRRSTTRIQTWASDNRYQVESVHRLWFSTGQWGRLAGGRSRRYFDVVVRDFADSTRSGTVRVSGGVGGLIADSIEVKWA